MPHNHTTHHTISPLSKNLFRCACGSEFRSLADAESHVGNALSDEEDEPVIRYVPTYVNKDGMRTLMRAAQGRETFATAEEAQEWLTEVLINTPPAKIKEIYGENAYPLEVRPVECWPGHHDPKTVWFD